MIVFDTLLPVLPFPSFRRLLSTFTLGFTPPVASTIFIFSAFLPGKVLVRVPCGKTLIKVGADIICGTHVTFASYILPGIIFYYRMGSHSHHLGTWLLSQVQLTLLLFIQEKPTFFLQGIFKVQLQK